MSDLAELLRTITVDMIGGERNAEALHRAQATIQGGVFVYVLTAMDADDAFSDVVSTHLTAEGAMAAGQAVLNEFHREEAELAQLDEPCAVQLTWTEQTVDEQARVWTSEVDDLSLDLYVTRTAVKP